jgi:predicted transcriptional regulator
MLSLKESFFEIQLLLNILMITAIVILAFLYLKVSSAKKKNPLVEKIEYLCKNLKVLIEKSEQSSDKIQEKIEGFKILYDKNITEVEKKSSNLRDVISKLESNDNIKDKLQEKDDSVKIKNLLNEGHAVDDIAQMLKISKGEVELISKLNS